MKIYCNRPREWDIIKLLSLLFFVIILAIVHFAVLADLPLLPRALLWLGLSCSAAFNIWLWGDDGKQA